MSKLYPCNSVNRWLRTKGGISYEALTPEAMRNYRLAWIDSMIAEFSA